MEKQLEDDPPIDFAIWKRNCSCVLVIIVIGTLSVWLAIAWLNGDIDDLRRWVRSFDFPAIEARFKPMADEFAAVTQDTLINQSHSMGQGVLMTNADYTGQLGGDYVKVFGTNRPVDQVVDDYARFLSSKPDWKINKSSDRLYATNSARTAEVSIRLAEKYEIPSETWIKYTTVYQVYFRFGDPFVWGG
jgi:hypothetical protein